MQSIIGKPNGKWLGRHRRGREDNIKMDNRGTGSEVEDEIRLTQDTGQCMALVNTVTNFRVP